MPPTETWFSDREIVVVKVLPHPRAQVFAAWTDAEALAAWYGPNGLAIETESADIREGGAWRFDMVGVFDGHPQRFANLMHYRRIVPDALILVDYGTPDPADPDRFQMAVTFDDQSDGKTVVTLRQLHPSRARRDALIGFGAVEYGLQTLDGLASWLDR